jgi:hypothetical protein
MMSKGPAYSQPAKPAEAANAARRPCGEPSEAPAPDGRRKPPSQ